jgi:heptosyltransferase-2
MKIILCPGSAENQKFKRWPAKKFYILAKLFLNSQYDVSIVLGPEEGYLEKEFGDIKIIKSPSFKDLKILGSLSNLIICNDSFLLHFFSFINANVLALYGPTDPTRTLPLNSEIITSNKSSKTRPCWNSNNYGKCDDGRCSCFDGLEPEDVYKKAIILLNQKHIN